MIESMIDNAITRAITRDRARRPARVNVYNFKRSGRPSESPERRSLEPEWLTTVDYAIYTLNIYIYKYMYKRLRYTDLYTFYR